MEKNMETHYLGFRVPGLGLKHYGLVFAALRNTNEGRIKWLMSRGC